MSFWDVHKHKVSTEHFRADTQFLGIQNIFPYEEITNYIKTLNKPWLDILKEDDSFSIVTRNVNGVIVSRDLLDSIMELEFLETQCGFDLNNMNILDIGAGYGRMAHRITAAYPNSFVYCTDAIPVSQDVCRKYLEFRSVKNAKVVAPDELDKIDKPDIALNIHSFPECTREEINGWLDWLVEHEVENFMVIPHQWASEGIYGQPNWNCEMFCIEDGKSFKPDIESHGYKLEKYWRPLESNPRDFYLFKLEV